MSPLRYSMEHVRNEINKLDKRPALSLAELTRLKTLFEVLETFLDQEMSTD